jgi:spore coat protein H
MTQESQPRWRSKHTTMAMSLHNSCFAFARALLLALAISVTLLITQAALAQNSQDAASLLKTAGADDFYRPDEVQSIHVQVAEQDMQRMLAALPERIYVPASFQWRDISLERVAIRFKGNSSSSPSQQHKRSFLIKFDEYTDNQQFLGLQRVSLDNGVQFGSVFSEPIITDILRDQGIKSHRSNYAKLFINQEYRGVYVNVERIDESFVERNFPDSKCHLFKVDEGGPGANLQFIGDNPVAYSRTFEPETKSAKKSQQRLVDFIKMINASPASEFAANLEKKMEVDDFLRTTAVLLLSGAFDQLTGWNPHNYYLCYDETRDRWHYLPWDLDVGFSPVAFEQIHVLVDWNAAWPTAGQIPNPLIDRIVADPELLNRYRDSARGILDKYFEPKRLCAIIDAKYRLIRDDLQADPFPHRRVTNPEDQNYDTIVESMKEFVRNRYQSARQQLENPGPRPAVNNRPGNTPPPFVKKMEQLQRAVQQMQRSGRDLAPIQKLMQQLGPLMQRGKMTEAEALLDQAIKLTDEKPKPR